MKKYIILTIAIFSSIIMSAQKRSATFDAYIEKYQKIAIANQKSFGIPASITLAQGLLESGAGKSRLAVQARNHFGIKCGGDWYGKTIKADDDRRGECFRSYNNVSESFKDHSRFLKRQRYAFLFDYKVTDYKAWAHGLKRAGYATDPKYPTKLISIIETYELYKYDRLSARDLAKQERKEEKELEERFGGETSELFGYIEIQNNGLRCVHLVQDDRIENIAKEFHINTKFLLYFNDMYKSMPLSAGDYVYLQPKKGKAEKGISKHKVQYGESMHSISQDYGIRMKRLYKINGIEYGETVKVGQIIKLKK